MMVVGGDARAHRTNDGQVVRLLRQVRKVFAELDAGCRCRGGVERPAHLGGRVRFHVPGVDVGRSAVQPDQDRRLRGLAPCRRGLPEPMYYQVEPEEAESAGHEEGAPVRRVVNPHRLSLADTSRGVLCPAGNVFAGAGSFRITRYGGGTMRGPTPPVLPRKRGSPGGVSSTPLTLAGHPF